MEEFFVLKKALLNKNLHKLKYIKNERWLLKMEKKTNTEKKKKKILKAVRAYTGKTIIKSDVTGSYTGVPTDSEDLRPIQDADDL